MRQTLKTLAVIAFSRAIAEKGIEACEPYMVPERALYRAWSEQAMQTLQTWPDRIRRGDITKIKKAIDQFCRETGWDNGGKHVQTHLNFSLALIEGLKDRLKDRDGNKRKINMIDRLIESQMAVYDRFSTGRDREYPLCLAAGLRAADRWDQIMDGW